ncbi:MAG: TonB-dependent receptor family protein [Bacteroidia bacterium]|nr:TonB-dependent receptor family protein [Bacteroidia bacterium]
MKLPLIVINVWLWISFPVAVSFGQGGRITGQVLDGIKKTPLPYATLSLINKKNSNVFGGGLTDSIGKFSILTTTFSNSFLQIRFWGYKTLNIDIEAESSVEIVDLGVLELSPAAQLVEEVEISGRKSRVYQKVDRQVFDAGQFQNAEGGSAFDVVKNLPSTSVDALGNISLRGSGGFLLLINGRQLQGDPSAYLNQIPANSIEQVEVITTPSAQFDPDGNSGIINIITKENATDGLFIQAKLLLGAPSIEPYGNKEASRRFTGDLSLSWKKGKWSINSGLDYRRNDIAGQRIGYVNTYEKEQLTEFPSSGERSFDRYQYSGRISASFSPNSNKELTLSLFGGDRTQFRTADILYAPQQRRSIRLDDFQGVEEYWQSYKLNDRTSSQGELIDSLTYFNENLRVREGDFLLGSLDYMFKFADNSQLFISALYERSFLGGPTDNASLAWPNIQDSLQYQFNTNDNPLDGILAKLDYTTDIDGADFAAGFQFRFLNHPGDFLYLDRDFENNSFIENPLFTNRILLRRQIYAIYSQISGGDKLSYNVGLRLEYMDRQVELQNPDTTFNYNILQPFPSLNLTYDLGGYASLKLGYSRRIQRTTTFKMTPFPEREHNETLEQGDAELLPEFINSLEIGFSKSWTDYSFYITPYYRRVENLINRVNTVFNDSILNRIYTNVGVGEAIGTELGFTLDPTNWWGIFAGGNVYRYQIEGDLFGDRINTANWIYSINAQSDFSLSYGMALQIGINFLSRRITAQGENSRFYNP